MDKVKCKETNDWKLRVVTTGKRLNYEFLHIWFCCSENFMIKNVYVYERKNMK